MTFRAGKWGETPAFAGRAEEQLAGREARVAVRELELDAAEEQLRGWTGRLRTWEGELQARKMRFEVASKVAAPPAASVRKVGRNERCPCRSGLKYKLCHGAGIDGRRDAINGVRSSHGFGPDLR